MDFWQRYRAIDSRDTRFDGQFVTAVATTRIYCRPSCPARTPKPANVTFYQTSAAAHQAGYRACKRCLPEAVPGTPDWNLRSDAAARAMRLISDGEVDRTGVPGLAARLGYSTRQLNRILHQELGAGPLALARATRAQTARSLLTSSGLKFADIAFAAGFSSVRQFNDTVQEVFALTPSDLRARARTTRENPDPGEAGTTLSLLLPLRAPYDPGIFEFLRVRAIDGTEHATADRYERLLQLPGGQGWFSARLATTPHGLPALAVSVSVERLPDLPVLLSRIRRLFDLDADPLAVDAVLGSDPVLADRVQQIPGIRLPGSVDPHEILIRAMIGQQITVKAARTGLHRLSVLGSPATLAPHRAPDGALHRLFPTAAQVADGGAGLLKGPARRIDSILRVSSALADGSVQLGVEDGVADLERKLLPLPGIGPWTVRYVAMRVLGATDIHLANDAAIRNGWATLTGQASQAEPPNVSSTHPAHPSPTLSTTMERCSPWRSYATMHLWRVAADHPPIPQAKATPR
ncbi:AlkA N-terminal domain-containing protein [Arthrobacter sp. 260]|uniref:DNA-3-methyladenine glycosylase 2 family protein n=1 Tax=Arthrobacter sp. 260 TaxID=2735314 RepID=UPI0014929A04|nr:AlkA N-terminal domain-containing protein [Arthrobacter sp. 260]NOJ61301.1 DNA-3-methyladenine glycosylase 2 family protein [Arthrobacter sp. 260]